MNKFVFRYTIAAALLTPFAFVACSDSKKQEDAPPQVELVDDNPSEFNIDDVIRLTHNKKVRSVEALLGQLPEEYLRNYVLVKESKSLQESSYSHPRAILFGNHANLIIAFNGDPNHRGYGSVEMIQFHKGSSEIEFRSIGYANGDAKISERNPTSCTTCHGNYLRPLHGDYPIWEHFYGQKEDRLDLTPGETEGFKSYLEVAATHPLYKQLWRDERNPNFPYQDCRVDSETEGPCWTHQYRPNDRLGILLGYHTAMAMAERIFENEQFKKYPNAFLYTVLPCKNDSDNQFKTALGKLFSKLYPEDSYPALYKEMKSFKFETQITNKFGVLDSEKIYQTEKIFSGLDVYTWGLTAKPLENGEIFAPGIMPIPYGIGARVFEKMIESGRADLAPYFIAKNYTYLHTEFYENYEDKRFVSDGGVEEHYNDVYRVYDTRRGAELCPAIRALALEELK